MPRQSAILVVSVAAPVLLGGCRVERTPNEYFDHASTIEAEREAAAGEVRDRLLAFVGAASRGNPAEAVIALNPADAVEIVGPMGLDMSGGGAIRAAMSQLVTTPAAVQVEEVVVGTGPAGNVAWFRMVIEAPGTTLEPSRYQATGTYLRDAGLWELVQAHVAGPLRSESGSYQPDSASTPVEDE